MDPQNSAAVQADLSLWQPASPTCTCTHIHTYMEQNVHIYVRTVRHPILSPYVADTIKTSPIIGFSNLVHNIITQRHIHSLYKVASHGVYDKAKIKHFIRISGGFDKTYIILYTRV